MLLARFYFDLTGNIGTDEDIHFCLLARFILCCIDFSKDARTYVCWRTLLFDALFKPIAVELLFDTLLSRADGAHQIDLVVVVASYESNKNNWASFLRPT
jgi:hypothetical protein